jgi:hypothetical protein
MEKSYRVVGNTGHWAVAEDGAEPAGDYATREGALEAIYFAASNDIKSGHGVTIRSTRRHRMHLLREGNPSTKTPLLLQINRAKRCERFQVCESYWRPFSCDLSDHQMPRAIATSSVKSVRR